MNPTAVRIRRIIMRLALFVAALGLAPSGARAVASPDGACRESSVNELRSCKHEARAAYALTLATCSNLADAAARRKCKAQAKRDRSAAMEECQAQLEARLELCDQLGEDPYDPAIDPARVVAVIDNPYLPMAPGTRFVYDSEDGSEREVLVVTRATKVIVGVTCVEVRDTVVSGGQVTEDTFDWFAQDVDGNVWYFGEHTEQYDDGELVGLEGSWQAGVDGAKPGIVMKASRNVGDVYRQEFGPGVAEDAAEILSLSESVVVPFGAFDNCVETKDFSPLEPDAVEHKYYATGIGVVLTIDLDTGEVMELVSVSTD
ncbi:MAG: hypothetical protein U1E76_07570 [Planctomycetota bacterium]